MGLVELLLGGLMLWWLMVTAIFFWIVLERERKARRDSREMAEARCKYGIRPEGENPRGPRYL